MTDESAPGDVSAIRRSIAEVWRADDPPEARLIRLVERLDRAYVAGIYRGSDDPVVFEVQRILSVAVLAADGAPFTSGTKAMEATRSAARAVIEAPGWPPWDALFSASTNTYPYGPGEGCHALEALGGHGEPGSGCVSGAGFLHAVGQQMGFELFLDRLERALGVPPTLAP